MSCVAQLYQDWWEDLEESRTARWLQTWWRRKRDRSNLIGLWKSAKDQRYYSLESIIIAKLRYATLTKYFQVLIDIFNLVIP